MEKQIKRRSTNPLKSNVIQYDDQRSQRKRMTGNNQMKALAEQVFIGEILLQSKIAQRAAKRLPAINDHFDQIEVWCSIQSILVTESRLNGHIIQYLKMNG